MASSGRIGTVCRVGLGGRGILGRGGRSLRGTVLGGSVRLPRGCLRRPIRCARIRRGRVSLIGCGPRGPLKDVFGLAAIACRRVGSRAGRPLAW